jgi:hypothetical protein
MTDGPFTRSSISILYSTAPPRFKAILLRLVKETAHGRCWEPTRSPRTLARQMPGEPRHECAVPTARSEPERHRLRLPRSRYGVRTGTSTSRWVKRARMPPTWQKGCRIHLVVSRSPIELLEGAVGGAANLTPPTLPRKEAGWSSQRHRSMSPKDNSSVDIRHQATTPGLQLVCFRTNRTLRDHENYAPSIWVL